MSRPLMIRRAALVLLLGLAIALPAAAQERQRRLAELEPLWSKLDLARSYRGNFAVRNGDTRDRVLGGGPSYDMIVSRYQDPTFNAALNGASPRDALRDLLGIGSPGQSFAMCFVWPSMYSTLLT